jgi:protein-tyrosine phosphatase
MSRRVLVVCVGNICRSPMAEALLARDLGATWSVGSAGLGAMTGQGMDAQAREVLQGRGLDLPDHLARPVEEDLLRGCDLVLVMETRHKEILEARFPWMRGRVFRLGHWEKFDIEDPYRRPREIFEQTLVRIESCCASWLPHLKAMG